MSSLAILITAVLILTAPLASSGQQPTKIARVGVLWPGSSDKNTSQIEALRRGFRERGYAERQNIVIEWRYADGRPEMLRDLAVELVRLKVDVIVTSSTPAAKAAKAATSAIPVVVAAAGDLVGTGLIASLARPGGNITGMTTMSSELGGKRFQLLKEVIPHAVRVAILWNSTNQGNVSQVKDIQSAARTLDVQLLIMDVRDTNQLDQAFHTMTRRQAEALVVLLDPLFISHGTRILDLAAKSRLPAMYAWRDPVNEGGLMSYGPSIPDMFRRAAGFVDRILKGAKPADLPVEQPTKFELVINLKTAKALGLTIPQSVLLRADELIR